MITNASCTIFRRNGDLLEKILDSPCMWQETEGYEAKRYGTKNADKAVVFISDITVDIRKGDYIFKGSISDISEKELYSALHVNSIDRNDFGSANMQHIKLGVR